MTDKRRERAVIEARRKLFVALALTAGHHDSHEGDIVVAEKILAAFADAERKAERDRIFSNGSLNPVIINSADILASDMPHQVIVKLCAAIEKLGTE